MVSLFTHWCCAMACFRLLHDGYDTEVIFVYGTEPVLLYFFFYYWILWYVTYTLIVTSYYAYLYLLYYLFILFVFNVYMWESIMNPPSLPTSHFSGCCCESTLSLCTPISILLLCYWIGTSSCGCCLSLRLWSIGSWHTWHSRHTYYWLSAFFIKSCNILLWDTL